MSAAPLTEIAWRYPANVTDELGFPCVVDHDEMVVCSVLDDGIDEVQQEARCHLIAATPALLKALKELTGNAEIARVHLHGVPELSSALFDTICQANDAIRQAEPHAA